jgi:hypothetical protein
MPDTWVTPRIYVAGEKMTASKKNDESNNFRVLWPYTTAGDMAYRNPAGAYLTRFALGAAGEELLSNGTNPLWVDGTRYIPTQLNADVALTTGDGKGKFFIPPGLNGWNITYVGAVRDSGATGVPLIQLRNVTDGVDVLSTRLSIDSAETYSGSAAAPAVIDTTKDDVAEGDLFAWDVDAAGTATYNCIAMVGLKRT